MLGQYKYVLNYIKNLVTTPKSMTNASRDNSMLRFQPFALRLQIKI